MLSSFFYRVFVKKVRILAVLATWIGFWGLFDRPKFWAEVFIGPRQVKVKMYCLQIHLIVLSH
jgi:hypothetical protein